MVNDYNKVSKDPIFQDLYSRIHPCANQDELKNNILKLWLEIVSPFITPGVDVQNYVLSEQNLEKIGQYHNEVIQARISDEVSSKLSYLFQAISTLTKNALTIAGTGSRYIVGRNGGSIK